VYLQEIARQYGVPEKTVRESTSAPQSKQQYESERTEGWADSFSPEEKATKSDVIAALSGSDRFLITLALESYENLEKLEKEFNLHSEIFSNTTAARFFDNISTLAGSDSPLSALMLSENCEQAYKEAAAEMILSAPTLSKSWEKYAVIDMEDGRLGSASTSIKKVLLKSLDEEKRSLSNELSRYNSGGTSLAPEIMSILKRIQEIDALKIQYLNEIRNENS
jgi:hypothetical protein